MTIGQLAILVALSIAIGLLMGVIGGGGGGLYVVVLVAFLGEDAQTAVGTALVLSTVTLAGTAWQYWRRGQVRIDYCLVLSIPGCLGSALGGYLTQFIPADRLKIAIIAMFVISGLSSLWRVSGRDAAIRPARERGALLAPIGFASGVLTGSLGLGGTAPLSSLLIGLLGFAPHLAVGTAVVTTVALNLTGALFHAGGRHLDLPILGVFAAGSILGALPGAALAARVNRKAMITVLAVLTIASAVVLAVRI
jgi:uncharacterized membrane protein YfcA